VREVDAGKFLNLVTTITTVKGVLNASGNQHAARIPEDVRVAVKSVIGELRQLTETLDAKIATMAVADLGKALEDDASTYGKLNVHLKDVELTFFRECRGRLLIHIDNPRRRFYSEPLDNFGTIAVERFPAVEHDVEEAGKCLALGRSTACVMHLMRILEVGLVAMMTSLGLPPKNENWQSYIQDIEAAIRSRNKHTHGPQWKDVDEPIYSEAATHFHMLKNAWRNHAMHSKQAYTTEKAQQIYDSVSAFMAHLAEKLPQPKGHGGVTDD
jgi:hypothetical protein